MGAQYKNLTSTQRRAGLTPQKIFNHYASKLKASKGREEVVREMKRRKIIFCATTDYNTHGYVVNPLFSKRVSYDTVDSILKVAYNDLQGRSSHCPGFGDTMELLDRILVPLQALRQCPSLERFPGEKRALERSMEYLIERATEEKKSCREFQRESPTY